MAGLLRRLCSPTATSLNLARVVSRAFSTPTKQPENWELFTSWAVENNKTYRSKEELMHRYDIFCATKNTLDKMNGGAGEIKYELNLFADMTAQELSLARDREKNRDKVLTWELVLELVRFTLNRVERHRDLASINSQFAKLSKLASDLAEQARNLVVKLSHQDNLLNMTPQEHQEIDTVLELAKLTACCAVPHIELAKDIQRDVELAKLIHLPLELVELAKISNELAMYVCEVLPPKNEV